MEAGKCEHPEYEKIPYLGADDPDYRCRKCGELLSTAEVKEIDRRKRESTVGSK